MASDFALKALINTWSVAHLGPLPFKNIGQCSNSIDLRFIPSELTACPSAQLQKVGSLCENGQATVKAMSGTIVFTVDAQATDTSAYRLEILTVATNSNGYNLANLEHQLCHIGPHKGTAGHVLLRYPSGGLLLCSAGHWLELVQLDVSMESLLKVAAKDYGAGYSSTLKQEISAAPVEQQPIMVQQYASLFVQQSSPCMYTPSVPGKKQL